MCVEKYRDLGSALIAFLVAYVKQEAKKFVK